jgi:hypothetical protein
MIHQFVVKKTGGRSYVTGYDWDTGKVLTSVDPHDACEFHSATQAELFARNTGLDLATWSILRRRSGR